VAPEARDGRGRASHTFQFGYPVEELAGAVNDEHARLIFDNGTRQ
jgi:hypothetical protein